MASSPPRSRRRANGEGSIYYVKSEARWRGAIAWTDAEGQPKRQTVAGGTQADVRRRLTELRRDLDRDLSPPATVTVAAHLTSWLGKQRQRVRPATWRQREQVTRLYLVPALGVRALAKLTPQDVERMTTGLVASGRSPRTAAHARVILRTALADAERDGLVHRNVAALARPPRVEQPELRYLDRPALRRLMDSTKDHSLGPLVALAATTGLRQGELLGLSWSDVDLDAERC